MVRELTAEPLDEHQTTLGEGPVWDADADCLVRVDILGRRVLLTEAGGETRTRYRVPDHVGAALPAGGDRWLLALRDRFAVLHADGRVTELLTVLTDDALRFNDAACDPLGTAFAGTMRYDEAPGDGTLLRLDPGPVATPVLTGQGLCNGLGWSPDGRTCYFADTLAGTVRAFDRDPSTGELRDPRVLVEIPAEAGAPDGLCTDDDGCLWIALYDGGAVRRYTPDGTLDTVLRLPVAQVTSCAFGGPGRGRLYVTTASQGMDDAERAAAPLAGVLFAVEPGIGGPAGTPWRG